MKKNIQIHCKYDELINPKKLKNHPKNRNGHGQDQIERLAELFEYHGIRHPIIVSNQTGLICAGHGRKLAAIRAGIEEYPVVYQDFETSEAEYAFLQADNAIALWSELDLSGINTDLPDLGPDFDIKMLGLKDFKLDPSEFNETKDTFKDDIKDKYSSKISSPVYSPKQNDPPLISELIVLEKYISLVAEIKSKKLSKEVETFLLYAAARHIRFNYENIAEFYCHQTVEVQNLMEKSALIIIDFNKAIDNGFVKLTEELESIFQQNNEENE